MNKSLYEEAIADAQQLRELAEETAKNRVVEAVMPQIRDLVNRRILGEQLDDLEDDEFEDFSPPEAADELDLGFEPERLSVAPVVGEPVPTPDEGEAPVINVAAQGDVNINVDSSDEEDEDLVLTDTMAEALGRLIRGESPEALRARVIKEVTRKIKRLLESVDERKLTSVQKRRLSLSFNYCLREALKLHSFVILNGHDTQDNLERNLAGIIKEMRTMSKSNRRNVFDLLFEDEGKKSKDLPEADLVLDLEDEEVEDLAAAEDADAVDAALEDILATVELSLGGEEGEAEGEEEEEFAPEGGEEEDLDFGAEPEPAEEGHVYEIDESSLRRELQRMRRLREQEEGRAAEADPSLNHGGEDLGHVILDIDEDDLVNALADELGDPGVPTPDAPGDSVGPGRDAMPESYSRRRNARRRSARGRRPARRIAETSRRESKQLGQYRHALSGMKRQLVEMNLFNAKLLYANKLMQNKNLSVKQQRAIVEALDNAKTLREAKLLYKSLSGSLSRRSRGRNLNEGNLRTLGSSSRSTRSAQPAASGIEADRWAVLAGIASND